MKTVQQKRLHIKTSKLMNSLFIGNFKAVFAGKWIEFQDFREYSPGDDAKYIDWLTSSKEGTIVMRRYREEKQWNILCLLDISESLYFWNQEKLQVLDELIELIARACFSSWESFGGYLLGEKEEKYIAPEKSILPLYKLKKYNNISPRRGGNKLSLTSLVKKKWRKSIVFVVSDSLDIDKKSFQIAWLKHDIVYVHISSYFENTLDGKGLSHLRNKGLNLWINLDDMKAKEIYKQKRESQLLEFSRSLRKIGIDSVFIDERTSIFVEFLKLMKRREK